MELSSIADLLRDQYDRFHTRHSEKLQQLMACAKELQQSWSGSNLGYHAYVYYEGLVPKPPGAQFSREWGLMDMSYTSFGSIGHWREYSSETIKNAIRSKAGDPDLSDSRHDSVALSESAEDCRSEIISTLTLALDTDPDDFLTELKEEAEKIRVLGQDHIGRAMLRNVVLMSRDSNAVMAGAQLAPHQEIIAELLALQSGPNSATALATIARRVASHLKRKKKGRRGSSAGGTTVFIGHGGADVWRELKDFVVDRLELPYEEFNRVPVAGITNIARLSEMLDGVACALVVLTAEDEQADGSLNARMNVVHEAGLFQGRLGFTKAIVVLEEGCAEFSNIQGLGQIRFPSGYIGAAFEEIRAVLEREGILGIQG